VSPPAATTNSIEASASSVDAASAGFYFATVQVGTNGAALDLPLQSVSHSYQYPSTQLFQARKAMNSCSAE